MIEEKREKDILPRYIKQPTGLQEHKEVEG